MWWDGVGSMEGQDQLDSLHKWGDAAVLLNGSSILVSGEGAMSPSSDATDNEPLVRTDSLQMQPMMAASSPSTGGVDDTPIRGLLTERGQDLTIEELIAQGEAQMRAAQLKHDSAKSTAAALKIRQQQDILPEHLDEREHLEHSAPPPPPPLTSSFDLMVSSSGDSSGGTSELRALSLGVASVTLSEGNTSIAERNEFQALEARAAAEWEADDDESKQMVPPASDGEDSLYDPDMAEEEDDDAEAYCWGRWRSSESDVSANRSDEEKSDAGTGRACESHCQSSLRNFDDDHEWGELDDSTAVGLDGEPGNGQSNFGSVGSNPAAARAFEAATAPEPSPKSSTISAPSFAVPVPPPPEPEGLSDAHLRDPSSPPPQSELVRRVFGTKGPATEEGSAASGTRPRRKQWRGSADGSRRSGRRMQKETSPEWEEDDRVLQKLNELEQEASRLRRVRRQQESALADMNRRREEVRKWGESERAAVEGWCEEQRAEALRERRQASKQAQLLRARARSEGSASEKKLSAALREELEQQRVNAEQDRKRARATEKRYQQQVKVQTDRLAQLEEQVRTLEKERMELLMGAPPPRLGNKGRAKSVRNSEGSSAAASTQVREGDQAIIEHDDGGDDAREQSAASDGCVEDVGWEVELEVPGVHANGMDFLDVRCDNKDLYLYDSCEVMSIPSSAGAGDMHDQPVVDVAGSADQSVAPVYDPLRYQSALAARQEMSGKIEATQSQHPALERSGAHFPAGKVRETLPDGTEVVWFRNGSRKELDPEGTTTVYFANGDTKRTHAGGLTIYHYFQAGITHTTHVDGTEVFEFPHKQREIQYVDGRKKIEFPDGTRKLIHPDGTEETWSVNGARIKEYPQEEVFQHRMTGAGAYDREACF